MPSVLIETHGCKLNTADSQQMAAEFARAGFKLHDRLRHESPDIFVLNSCTVTHVADKKARQSLSTARRKYPNALTVVAGCYPERAADEIAELKSVDLIIGNRDKRSIVQRVWQRLQLSINPCSEGRADLVQESLLGRTRASIKIQEGCDQVCAYCIVPKVRGREYSVPTRSIIRQVQELHRVGCQEVVFTGTQLGHYGFDMEAHSLASMLRAVLKHTDMPRIRVSSLQPPEIDEALLSIWIEEGIGRLAPHFHIPLQSGSDRILRTMRRTYASTELLSKVELVRSLIPDCGITTDVIAGFPGETEADHRRTLAVMRSAKFSAAHIFPYSPRPGTSAHYFDQQLEPQIRARRAQELRSVALEQALDFRRSQLGSVKPVLWEDNAGLTDNYIRVRLANQIDSEGASRENRIENVTLKQLAADGTVAVEPIHL